MPIELKIPVVGESITEVQISEWLKAEGDIVQKDEPVAVIDSEKTTFELPAPESGTLAKILHKAGDTVNVGEVVAQIESGGAPPIAAKSAQAKAARPEKVEARNAPEATASSKGSPPAAARAMKPPSPNLGSEREAAEPVEAEPVMQKARSGDGNARSETKPTLASPTKTAPPLEQQTKRPADGRAASPRRTTPIPTAEREEEVVPMTMLRRTIARRLVEAQQTMAMLTTFNEVDMSAVQSLRREHQEVFQQRYGVKLGLMSFFVKAAIDALKQFPQLNAEVRENNIVYRNYFDIGVAIAAERGLVVPVLRRAERLSFAEVEKAIGDFTQRAKENTLNPTDLEDGTFTITNGGVFGSLLSTPIINPPQSGILGLHAIEDRPVARGGNVVIRPMMYVALTYDHRLVDGREAVLFLRRVGEAIENPARMLMEV